MTDQGGAAPEGDGRKRFGGLCHMMSGDWHYICEGADLPLSDLVGKVVNIGDKDGGVWDTVTVTACDARTGKLTLQGGGYGARFRDTEAKPFEGTVDLYAHDIARGYIHPEPTKE